MKILMLPTYYGGISWWRFEIPAIVLRKAGHEVTRQNEEEMQAALKGKTFLDWLLEEMPKYDVVHVGYTSIQEIPASLFKARDVCGVPVVTDIDDDIDNVPPYNPGWKTFRPGGPFQRIARLHLQHSDAVTFSTAPLQKALGYLNPVNDVLGNWPLLDSWDYPADPMRARDKSVRLLLAGGAGRYGDWQLVREPLESTMRTFPEARLFFLGGTPDWITQWMSSADDPQANRAWAISASDPKMYQRIMRWVQPDIVVTPVTKNPFNASKSVLKFYEASLSGAAFICTDWPTYDLAPNDCCIKVDNTATQWTEAIANLVQDKDLRTRLHDRALDHVVANCRAEDHIEQRLALYERVAEVRHACSR